MNVEIEPRNSFSGNICFEFFRYYFFAVQWDSAIGESFSIFDKGTKYERVSFKYYI
jgi:hypothetical protein